MLFELFKITFYKIFDTKVNFLIKALFLEQRFDMCYLERNGNMALNDAFIMDVITGTNSEMHSFSSQVGKGSSLQNLLTDLLVIHSRNVYCLQLF